MDRSVTLKDIAGRLGVSITTVSKALNGHPDISERRKREILRAVRTLNYIPNVTAKNLRKSSSHFIGFVISDNSNPYFSQVFKGAEAEISVHNFQMITVNNNEDVSLELKLIRDLKSVNVAGVAITPALSNPEGVALLRKLQIPFVLMNRYVVKDRDNCVLASDFEVGRQAATYLLEKRTWDIVFINGDERISAARDRRAGFESALRDHGIRPGSRRVIPGALNHVDGYEAAKKVLSRFKLPLSILCFSDYVATGVLGYMKDVGINVPQEAAVMGVDNIGLFSFWSPRLTTVDIPEMEIGRRAVRLLFDVISKKRKAPTQIMLEPTLVIRETA